MGKAQVLTGLGYEEPTPIQSQSIPPLLAGKDLLGQAATGTGKTGASALQLLQRALSSHRKPGPPAVLVLVPTRELAIQVAEAFLSYGAKLGAVVLPVYGGAEFGRQVLAKQPRPKGPHLTILTNAGGPGVLAVDALIASSGQPTELSADTMKALNETLPPQWSHNNPVDILGDASPERYAKALEIAATDPNSDGILVILTPQAMTDPTKTAEILAPYAQSLGKPVIATWMGGKDVAAGEAILNKASVPTFPYPDTAARVFNYMAKFSENLRLLYETPMPVGREGQAELDRECAERLINRKTEHRDS